MFKIKPYQLVKFNNFIVVIGIDYQRLDDYDDFLLEELCYLNYFGELYFDFLLSNGLGSDRFYVANFNGKQLDFGSMKNIAADLNLQRITNNFFRENISLLGHGNLTRKEIGDFDKIYQRNTLVLG